VKTVEGGATLRKSTVSSKFDVKSVGEVGGYPLILDELSQLIALLEEADLPSSTRDPKNEGLEARIRMTMKRYFRALGVALPQEEIERIYYRYVEQE
jgi:hypothetical protein